MDSLLALPNGTELVGDFRLKRVLGVGGFGITYLAKDLALNRNVAIKEYFPSEFAAREGAEVVRFRSQSCEEDYRTGLERFIDEAQALARFEHPNIVRVFRYFRANNTAYMVLQFEAGRSFKAWLDDLGRVPLQGELDQTVAPLLDALELLHGNDFLHRDIAPDNIIIRPDGTPVLIDFGSARGEIAARSRTVSAIVKPGYSPFEQYSTRGKKQGPWTDIYSLAATLYHAVSGERPLDAPTRMSGSEIRPMRQFANGDYRVGFLAAVDHGLNVRAENRPQSVVVWRRALFGGDPVQPEVPPPAFRDIPLGAGEPAPANMAPTKALAQPGTPGEPEQPDQQASRPAAVAPAEESNQGFEKVPEPVIPPELQPAPQGTRKIASGASPALVWKRPTPKPPEPIAQPADLARQEDARTEKPEPKPKQKRKPAKAADAKNPARSLLGALAKVRSTRSKKSRGAASAPRAEKMPASDDTSPKPKEATPKPKAKEKPKPKKQRARRTKKPKAKVARAPVQIGAILREFGRASARVTVRLGLIAGFLYLILEAPKLIDGTHKGQVVTTRESLSDLPAKLGLIRTLRGHDNAVVAMARAPGSDAFLSVDARGKLIRWPFGAGTDPAAVTLDGADVVALAATQERVVLGRSDGNVFLVPPNDDARPKTLRTRENSMNALALTGSGRTVAIGGDNKSIRLIDVSRGSWRTLRGHDQAVTALAAATGADRLVSGSTDDTVRLWSLRRRKLLRTFHVHAGDVTAVALTAKAGLLASGSVDRTIKLWEPGAPEQGRTLTGHEGTITALAFLDGGTRLLSASEDNTVKLWQVSTGELVHTFIGHTGAVRALTVLEDGKRFASAGDDQTIRLWGLESEPGS